MTHDIEMLNTFYAHYKNKVYHAKEKLNRPLTLAEKILYAHLFNEQEIHDFHRGEDYVNFRPNRVAMQDATAQMALLQFMNAGKEQVDVPSSVHCDHLILAHHGVETDLPAARAINAEVYDFLRSASSRYGIGFWEAGAGIIHQVVLENYAFPGGMMVGTDSHTPNAGGMAMLAIGVGGADAVDVMTGMEWELKMPRIIGVRLSGQLSGWASAKDVILRLAGLLTVKGGTNAIIEYFGEGTKSISATGKATICNMGAEVGATTSVFPFDQKMAQYLSITGREDVAKMALMSQDELKADAEIELSPELYYDRVIDINLSELEPYVNGPFTPDLATPISQLATYAKDANYPMNIEVALIGSCTNSSYQDLYRAASVAQQAYALGLRPKAKIIINPGSDKVYETAERDGLLDELRSIGAIIMTNACGPCIGQWQRDAADHTRPNSIMTSFNRNFAKRADGNPATHAFISSPEMAIAFAFGGTLAF
ncbi:MAG: aconitase family protein, partial [Bacteroidaceae bacterium]